MAAPPLVGRERELRVLDDLVDRVSERGRALVLRGEAGIGKSRCWARQAHALGSTGWWS